MSDWGILTKKKQQGAHRAPASFRAVLMQTENAVRLFLGRSSAPQPVPRRNATALRLMNGYSFFLAKIPIFDQI